MDQDVPFLTFHASIAQHAVATRRNTRLSTFTHAQASAGRYAVTAMSSNPSCRAQHDSEKHDQEDARALQSTNASVIHVLLTCKSRKQNANLGLLHVKYRHIPLALKQQARQHTRVRRPDGM